jgi:hypothetical protein
MTLSSADQLFADKMLTEIASQEMRSVRRILGMGFSILVEVLSLVVIVFMQPAVQRRASESY